MPVAVVSDSTPYLPPDLAAELGVHEVSLYVNEGGTLVRESDLGGEDGDFSDFYGRLRGQSDLPTTSQPSIGDFLAVYEPLVESGYDIVSVHLGGAISGTVESARQAAAELTARGSGRRIEVLDSRSACGGLGGVVVAAATGARSGEGIEQVTRRTQSAIDSVRIWFSVDTLEYLRRGGRIGLASAWVGGALKIKPILTITDDGVVPIERVRTERRAFERMVDYLRARHADGATAWIVQHIQAREQAERVIEQGRGIFGTEPLYVSEIGPVIGTHAGPGLIGVAGLPPHLVR